MAERRMAEVVSEAQGFGQILVEAERPGDCAANLRDLDAVSQPNAEMIPVGRDEHLGLVAEAAEGDRMDDAVAVALEDVARPARGGIDLGMKASARSRRLRGNAAGKAHSVPSGTILSDSELVQLNASMPTVSRSALKVSASDVPRNGPITSRARSELWATKPLIPSNRSRLRNFIRRNSIGSADEFAPLAS